MRRLSEEQKQIIACYEFSDKQQLIQLLEEALEAVEDHQMKDMIEELLQVLPEVAEIELR